MDEIIKKSIRNGSIIAVLTAIGFVLFILFIQTSGGNFDILIILMAIWASLFLGVKWGIITFGFSWIYFYVRKKLKK